MLVFRSLFKNKSGKDLSIVVVVEKEDDSGGGQGDKLSHCIGEIPDWRNLFSRINFLREAPYGQKRGRRGRVGSV